MNHLDAFYLIFASVTLFLSLTYFLLNSYFSLNTRKFKRVQTNDISDVTVLIPVYGEKEEVFERVVSSVSRQGVKFLVVGDGCDEPTNRSPQNMEENS